MIIEYQPYSIEQDRRQSNKFEFCWGLSFLLRMNNTSVATHAPRYVRVSQRRTLGILSFPQPYMGSKTSSRGKHLAHWVFLLSPYDKF